MVNSNNNLIANLPSSLFLNIIIMNHLTHKPAITIHLLTTYAYEV